MIEALVEYSGIVLGIIGLVLTVFFALRYAEKKDPRLYSVHFERIATPEDAPEDLSISYRGASVNRVTTSLIWLWNAGKRPIQAADIPPTQPIRIRLTEHGNAVSILDVKVVKSSRPSIELRAERHGEESAVLLSFAFLDHNDGALVEIQHNGSPFAHVEVGGVILGAAKGIRLMEPFARSYSMMPGDLMQRVRNPLRDRAQRLAIVLFWLVLAGWQATGLTQAPKIGLRAEDVRRELAPQMARDPQLRSAITRLERANRPGWGIVALRLFTVLIPTILASVALRAAMRPMYSVPRTLAPTAPKEVATSS